MKNSEFIKNDRFFPFFNFLKGFRTILSKNGPYSAYKINQNTNHVLTNFTGWFWKKKGNIIILFNHSLRKQKLNCIFKFILTDSFLKCSYMAGFFILMQPDSSGSVFFIVLLKPEFLESFWKLVTKIRNSKLCFYLFFF